MQTQSIFCDSGLDIQDKLCAQVLANAPFSALYYTFYSSLQRRFQQVHWLSASFYMLALTCTGMATPNVLHATRMTAC